MRRLVVISLLLRCTAGLLTTTAKCVAGYQWTFSSIGQSPCDIAAELAAVCVGGNFDLLPLDTGFVYAGPPLSTANSCRCSSVHYSLLSACGYCQTRNYIRWSAYSTNCSTIFLNVFPNAIPEGVRVPSWAYQDVTVGDTFNVTLAQRTRGPESTRSPQMSSSKSSASSSSYRSPTNNSGMSQATIAGIAGGLAGLCGLIIGGIVAFCLVRRKQRSLAARKPVVDEPVTNAQTQNTNIHNATFITPVTNYPSGISSSFPSVSNANAPPVVPPNATSLSPTPSYPPSFPTRHSHPDLTARSHDQNEPSMRPTSSGMDSIYSLYKSSSHPHGPHPSFQQGNSTNPLISTDNDQLSPPPYAEIVDERSHPQTSPLTKQPL